MAVAKDGATLIAVLDRSDFERARKAVDGLDVWDTFEDYRCDREGRWIGLASAGQSARLAPVSIIPFLTWCASRGLRATSSLLDEFAELVDARNPNPRQDPPLSPEAVGADCGAPVAAIDPQSYRDWLACLGADSSIALLDAYAGLLVESWTDIRGETTARDAFAKRSAGGPTADPVKARRANWRRLRPSTTRTGQQS
jgi:hypothetical protein